MKRKVTLSLLLTVFAAAAAVAHAQSGGATHGHMMAADTKGTQATTPAPVHKGAGVVRKVDPAKGTITLEHGRIASLNWPPMVMAFSVRDKSLLDKAQAGRKVEFEFVQQGRDNVITSLK